MKANSNYKSKRIAIIAAILVVLIGAASVGTYFYMKSNETARATDITNNQTTDSNNEPSSDNRNSGENNNGTTEGTQNADTNQGATGTGNNQGTETTTPTAGQTNNGGTDATTRPTATNIGTQVNNGATARVTTNNDGTTTVAITNPDGTTTTQTTDATVITEREITERVISENSWIRWNQDIININGNASRLGINKFKLEASKEIINKDNDNNGKYDIGEKISYLITVTNIGNAGIEEISLVDTLNGRNDITTANRIDENDNIIEENIKLNEYKFNLGANQKAYFKYDYIVKEADILEGKIENIVSVSSRKANVTTNAKVDTEEESATYKINKEAKLVKTNTNSEYANKAEVGDTIEYTVSVENTGNVSLQNITVEDVTMGQKVVIEKIEPKSTVEAINFSHVVSAEDVSIKDNNVIVLNSAVAQVTDPTDPSKTIEEETEKEVDAKDVYSYKVNYLEKDTEKVLNNQKTVNNQKFNTIITSKEEVIEIDGYNFDNADTDSLKITADEEKNVINLYYTKRTDLSYTVHYKEQGTEKTLADDKKVDGQTFEDKITEKAIDIDGYNKEEPTSAEIEITTGANEATFYYTKRTDLTGTVKYFEKGTTTEIKTATPLTGLTFGATVVATDYNDEIDGYVYDSANPEEITVATDANKNVLNLYYTKRTDLTGTVKYFEKGTTTEIKTATPLTGLTFGATVVATDYNQVIDGYVYDSANPEEITVATDANKNVLNLYYTKRTDLTGTVKYFEKGTTTEIKTATPLTGLTFGATVVATDYNDEIDGYVYDSANPEEITVATDANKNILNLYYTKRTDLTGKVKYFEKGTTTEIKTATPLTGLTFGAKVVATDYNQEIEGYVYDSANPEEFTVSTTSGSNILNLYYTKKSDLTYTIHYYKEGTTTKVADDKYVEGKTFGESVTENAKDVEGYEALDPKTTTFTIKDGVNEYAFYYEKYLEVNKTVNKSTTNIGETIKYQITITNENSSTKTTTLIDTLPDGITIVDSESNGNAISIGSKLPDGKGILTEKEIENENGTKKTVKQITWADIEVPNGEKVVTYYARVNDNMIGKTITNKAEIINLGGKSSTASTKVNEISVSKTEVKPGETGKDSVNIVLVMDLSYSMTYTDTSDGSSRLAAAKSATTNFINKIYYDSKTQQPTNSKATVSVITFNTPETMADWSYSKRAYTKNPVAYSGVNVIGNANKDNYNSLITEINKISLPSSNPERDNYNGLGTYMYGGLEQAEETLNTTSSSDKKNVVIFLSDGDPTYQDRYGRVVEGYEKNSSTNIIAKANSIKYNEDDELVTDFYSIGFGKDASNSESIAYGLLSQMSSNGTVFTSNSVDELVANFVNILADIGIKNIKSNVGVLDMTIATELIVSETYPITVSYNGTDIITITDKDDLNKYKFSLEGTSLKWDVNAWNESCTAENGRVKVIETNKAAITYYTSRTEKRSNVKSMSLLSTFMKLDAEEANTTIDTVQNAEIAENEDKKTEDASDIKANVVRNTTTETSNTILEETTMNEGKKDENVTEKETSSENIVKEEKKTAENKESEAEDVKNATVDQKTENIKNEKDSKATIDTDKTTNNASKEGENKNILQNTVKEDSESKKIDTQNKTIEDEQDKKSNNSLVEKMNVEENITTNAVKE